MSKEVLPGSYPHPTTDISKLALKVGLEIHQQLATKNKLFCDCVCEDADQYYTTFTRKLRPVRSELGKYDAAAIFEYGKARTIEYSVARQSSCLVEADEEPPHDINSEALETALIFSVALNSHIVDEVQVMRKIVIDGSNTSGFQRTALIATGGSLDVNGKNIGVQSICLEEDAAKLLSLQKENVRRYGLDRLGTPLVEIALDPITGTPAEITQVALTLGRLLRSSKRVARGLGSIRQDVNVSIMDGPVVEIKGVQKLDQLTKVIQYEAARQHALLAIAAELAKRKIVDSSLSGETEDITELISDSNSKIIRKILDKSPDSRFIAFRAAGFAGILGFEPFPDVRLGKELGKLVGLFGLNGVIHSDEDLVKYGLSSNQIESIKKKLGVGSLDAFVVIGGPREVAELAAKAAVARLRASIRGVPPETRSATADGRTEYMRPRPGSSRMYPETDIPPVSVTRQMLDNASSKAPRPWDEIIRLLETKYSLNTALATQIFDSDYMSLFEDILQNTSTLQPTFVAAKLTEDLTSLERRGLDSSVLPKDTIKDIFVRLDRGDISRESVVQLYEVLMKKEAASVDEAIKKLGLTSISDAELSKALDSVLKEHSDAVKERGIASMGMLMGRAMVMLKGKADGQRISNMLKEKLDKIIVQDRR